MMTRGRVLRSLLTTSALASLLALSFAASACADAGSGAQYQIELSGNCSGGIQVCLEA